MAVRSWLFVPGNQLIAVRQADLGECYLTALCHAGGLTDYLFDGWQFAEVDVNCCHLYRGSMMW